MPNEAPYEIDVPGWTSVFAVLSLDVATPFVARMGLDLPSEFRAGLRRLIEDFRTRESEPGIEMSFAPAVFAWSAEQFGRPFADRLHAWGRDVFLGGEDSGASPFLWNRVVRFKGYAGAEPSPPPPPFVLRVQDRLAQVSAPEVNQLQPTSEWDKLIYQRQNYDEYVNGMELVQNAIHHYDFVSAWASVRRELSSSSEREQVRIWGQEVARRMGLPIERLGEPGAWPDPPL